MGFDLRHLRAFSAVGNELHFGRAADALHIAQPALTKIIQQLEAEVGVPLLLRTTRRVELTAAGKAFLSEIATVEGQIDRAINRARHAARGIRGELRIAYTEPPRVYRRVSGSMIRLLLRRRSSLCRIPPLLRSV